MSPLSPSEKGQAFFAAKLVSCSKKHSLLCSGEHKNPTVSGQIRVSDRRQGRRLQPGLLNDAKLGGRKRAEESVTVPLGATSVPVDATDFQSDTGAVY